MTEHLLSINLLVALVGLIFILLTKRNQALIIKTAAAIISGIQVWIGIEMLLNFNPHETALQFAERIHWIDGLRIDYYIGIDSGNLVFLLMTALLIFVSVLISWRQEKRVKEYFTFLMILNLGLTGVFAAMNLFLFVIFLGLAFFAAYLMTGIYADQDGTHPADRLGIYFIVSYILILLGSILLFYANSLHTLNLPELISGQIMSSFAQIVAGVVFLSGLAILLPLFPFHSWLIPIIKKTPVGISIIIIGVMTKLGAYGLIRIFLPVLPAATHYLALAISIWGLISILYGAICALGSTDTDQILGYCTLQQMGFVLIGLVTVLSKNLPASVTGLSGAILLVSSHAALSTLLLFILKKIIPDGVAAVPFNPDVRSVIILTLLAGLGMPGFSDFIARFLIIIGAYQVPQLIAVTIISLFGILANFVVFIRLLRRTIFTQSGYTANQSVISFQTNEAFVIAILLIIIIGLGLFPGFLLNILKTGLVRIVELYNSFNVF